VFSDEERKADWCGRMDRACEDCRGVTGDTSIVNQCSDRIMCPKLAQKLIELLERLQNCTENTSKFIHKTFFHSHYILPVSNSVGVTKSSLYYKCRETIMLRVGSPRSSMLKQSLACQQLAFAYSVGSTVHYVNFHIRIIIITHFLCNSTIPEQTTVN